MASTHNISLQKTYARAGMNFGWLLEQKMDQYYSTLNHFSLDIRHAEIL